MMPAIRFRENPIYADTDLGKNTRFRTARTLFSVGGLGQRVPGGFLLITGRDGIRYALRPNQVAVVHDADECQDETVLRIHGGHIVRLPCSLEEVLAWVG